MTVVDDLDALCSDVADAYVLCGGEPAMEFATERLSYDCAGCVVLCGCNLSQ